MLVNNSSKRSMLGWRVRLKVSSDDRRAEKGKKMTQISVREKALQLLIHMEESNGYSHLLIHQAIKEEHYEPRDNALLTHLVYGTVTYQKTLIYYVSPFIKKTPEPWVHLLLQLSVYQMIYLDKVPDHAIINEAVKLAKKRGNRGISGFVNGVLRSVQRKGVAKTADIQDDVERLAVETSHPEWLVTYWLSRFSQDTVYKMCQANNRIPDVSLRTNTLKTDRLSLQTTLAREGVTTEQGSLVPESLVVKSGQAQHTPSFQNGWFAIQDESSMLPAYALDIQEHMQVLDCCAAPGGKTTHIAQMLHQTGQVTALDIYEHKVRALQEETQRLGLTNVTARQLDSLQAQEHFADQQFDRLLLDAPCSGLGVIRHKPDLKWQKSSNTMKELATYQSALLDSVAPLLKKGGLLVYSTCTVTPEENEEVISHFLKRHSNYSRDMRIYDWMPAQLQPYLRPETGYIKMLPHMFQTDGFFIALLRRDT